MITRARAHSAGIVLLLGVSLALLAACVYQSWNDIKQYSGIDLRNRVVFSRLLLAGQDLYFVDMLPDWPEERIDPLYYNDPVRLSVPPTGLLMYIPLCGLHYQTQRVIYFVLDWIELLAAAFLLALTLRKGRGRASFVALFVCFFAAGYFWRLHVERGQFYAMLLFLLSLAAWAQLNRRMERTAGVCLGLAAALRPTLIVVPLLLACFRKRTTAYVAAGTLALVVLGSLPLVGVSGWLNFAKAVQIWETEVTHPAQLPEREARKLPYIVEDTDFRTYLPGKTGNTALLGSMLEFGVSSRWLRRAIIPFKVLAVFLTLLVAYRVVVKKEGPRHPRHLLGLAIMAGFSVDYLLAPKRCSYTDVILLMPIALLWPLLWSKHVSRRFLTVVVAGLLIGFALNDQTGAFYRTYLLMLALDGLALVVLLRFQL